MTSKGEGEIPFHHTVGVDVFEGPPGRPPASGRRGRGVRQHQGRLPPADRMERRWRRMQRLRGLGLLSPRPRGGPAAARAARGARQPVAGETLRPGLGTPRQDRPRGRGDAGLHGGRDAPAPHPAAVRDAAKSAGSAASARGPDARSWRSPQPSRAVPPAAAAQAGQGPPAADRAPDQGARPRTGRPAGRRSGPGAQGAHPGVNPRGVLGHRRRPAATSVPRPSPCACSACPPTSASATASNRCCWRRLSTASTMTAPASRPPT